MLKNKICSVCNRNYGFRPFWELEKLWLRLTEISLLWENCCSERCYVRLLENLLEGKWAIEKDKEGRTILTKKR